MKANKCTLEIKAFLSDTDNAEYCSSHKWITPKYGTEEDRKEAAFFFQNSFPDLKRQGILSCGVNLFYESKKAIEAEIRDAGGDHNSYLARVKAEVKCDNELKKELGLTSLSIPESQSLPLSFGYNKKGEVGYSHNLALNDARREYIAAAKALSRFAANNPGQSVSKEYHRLYKMRNNRKSALSTILEAESLQLFERDTFTIEDILLDTCKDNGLVELVKGLIRAIMETAVAQEQLRRNTYEIAPFVTPDLQENVLQSMLSAKDYETMRAYLDSDEELKSFSGGTKQERKTLMERRRIRGRCMTKSMIASVVCYGEVIFDLSNRDAVNFLRYMGEEEAIIGKGNKSVVAKEKTAHAQYKDITEKLRQAWKTNKPMEEISRLEQEASQAWTHTTQYKDLQKVAIGSCSFADLLNDTVNNNKLRCIIKG